VADLYLEGQALMEQGRWARAVECFERLLVLEPGYEGAPARLAEAQREKTLADLYAEGCHHLEQSRFKEATECLQKVVQLEATYLDAATLLEETRRRHQFAQLVEKTRVLYEQERYEEAIRFAGRVLETDPENAIAKEVFRSAQKQLEIAHFYDAGLKYYEDQQWPEAIDFLGRVVRQRPDYRDAAVRLQVATRQEEMGKLYAKGMECARAAQWAEAVGHFSRIVEVEEQYRDAAQQLENARRQIEKRLRGIYDKAKEHLAAGRWHTGIQLLEQLKDEAPDFGDVGELLQQARGWKEQSELAAYYEQGVSHLTAGNWQTAIELFEYVKSRAPGFKDVDEQLKRAKRRGSRLSARQAQPVAQVQPAPRREYSVLTIVAGSLTVFVCCMAGIAALIVAAQSYPSVLSFSMPGLPTVRPASDVRPEATAPVGMMPAADITSTLQPQVIPTQPETPEVMPTASAFAATGTPLMIATSTPVSLSPSVFSATPTVRFILTTPLPVPAETTATRASVVGNAPPAVWGRPTAPIAATVVISNTVDKATQTPTAKPRSVTPTQTATSLAGRIAFPVYDPAGRRYSIYMANLDGSGLRAIASDASGPALSPNGALLAYRSWTGSDRRIMILDLATGQVNRLTRFAEDSRPDWSSEGQLVFNSLRESDRRSRLYIVGTWAGAQDAPLRGPGGSIFGDNANWLGASRIAYSLCDSGGCGIYVVNADGSGPTKIVDSTDRVSLDGSPDGRRVAYAAKQDGNWDVYVIGVDGSDAKRLTDDASPDWLPTWSPDGSHIAFVSNRSGNWAIWAMAADGTDQRKLFDLPGPVDGIVRDEPSWSSMGWIEERMSWVP
jgi:TolB protein